MVGWLAISYWLVGGWLLGFGLWSLAICFKKAKCQLSKCRMLIAFFQFPPIRINSLFVMNVTLQLYLRKHLYSDT